MGGQSQGFILICVLWVLALLTVITLGFGHRAMMERRVAAHGVDRLQTQYMARGAIERGIQELRFKEIIDEIMDKEGRTSFDQRWNQPLNLLDGREGLYTLSGPQETRGETARYRIRDEEGLICINNAPRRLLENIDGLGFRTIDDIMNRRESTEGDGRAFLNIEELRTLRGVDDRVWYGRNGAAGLRDILTVWGSDGDININTAPAAVLQTIPDLRENDADAIAALTRSGRGFSSIEELADELELQPDVLSTLRRHCKVDSTRFRVTGIATQRQGNVRAEVMAVVQAEEGMAELLDWREDVSGP